MARGYYGHPMLAEFSRRFPLTVIYTGLWPGFALGCEDTFRVEVIGKTRFVRIGRTPSGYVRSIMIPPIWGFRRILRFRPETIFTSAFGIWTLLVLAMKPIVKWRILVLYDGSSPQVDYEGSSLRIWLRRAMSRAADAFVTNSEK